MTTHPTQIGPRETGSGSARSRARRRPGLPSPLRRVLRSRLVSALAAPHGVDRYLEHLNPMWSLGRVRARIVARRREGARGATLVLRPNAAWSGFRAGQWVRLSIEVGGVRRTRCYSISSSETRADGLVEVAVQGVAGGRVSPSLVEGDIVGSIVELSQAEGDFTLPEGPPGHVLLLSGGSGITPCMSILRTLLDRGHAGTVTFAHWARTPGDLFFADELESIDRSRPNCDLRLSFTRADRPSPRLDAEVLRGLVPEPAQCEAWVCGPPGLVDAALAAGADLGLAGRMRVERFVPAVAPAASAGDTGWSIRLARSGRTIGDDGRTLLEQAEGAGLSPDSGCRMGICTTCRCRKVSGIVRDLRSGEVAAESDENIRLCTSVPLGDVTLDL